MFTSTPTTTPVTRRTAALAVGVCALLVPTSLAVADVAPADDGVTFKVSYDVTGTTDPEDRSTRARISQSGDFVVYESVARNLTDPIGVGTHVYFTDLSDDHHIVPDKANHTVMVDESPITGKRCRNLNNTNDASSFNEVSNEVAGNGPWVVFASKCIDLVPGWTHGGDVYIRNMRTGVIDVVSRANGNDAAPIAPLSTRPVISDDGRYVAWNSGTGAVYVRDMQDPTNKRTVTVTAPPSGTNDESLRPEISGDGSHLVFASDAALVAKDTNGIRDIYVVDLRAWQANKNVTTFSYYMASVSSTGVIGSARSSRPGINADGTIVTFETNAFNLVSDDRNAKVDAYWHNTVTGRTVLVSRNVNGTQAVSGSTRPQLDDSGYVVAFVSNARDIVAGDDNTQTDTFVRTLDQSNPANGVTRMISQTPGGDAGGNPTVCTEDPVAKAPGDPTGPVTEGARPAKDNISTRPYVNGDATRIVFVSGMCNLVAPRTPVNLIQIYVREYPPGGPQ